MVDSISLDKELIDLIEADTSRNELINSLLNGGYFSEKEILGLRKGIEVLDGSFKYEERINAQIKREFQMEHIGGIEEFETKRDPAFRRLVLSAYDETCSVCGLRLVTTSGISVIDAAHILPHARFKNDDVRNGLALCKTHHWLFDKGLMAIDGHYRVEVSKSIELEAPKRAVGLPKVSDISPRAF